MTKSSTEVISVRAPRKLIDRLRTIAAQEHSTGPHGIKVSFSLAELIKKAIEEFVERHGKK
jgi:hypothetical protein